MDLYAGMGSFGLECLYRKASQTLFVENDEHALINLNKNIKSLNVEGQTTIYSMDIFKFIKNLKFKKKIDLGFLDPPYRNRDYVEIFEKIKKKEILNKKHILVLHREKGSGDNLTGKVHIIENRVYGRSEIFFLRLF